MLAKLLHIWQSIRSSFWFIPGLMVLFALALSQVLLSLDRYWGADGPEFFPFIFNAGPEGARSVLSTIAGSMISIAGLTFSITMVVLTLASSQFGPRLMRNFMKDPRNQFILGTFISTFIYCLLVLMSVQSLEGEHFVPQASVTFSIFLAVANSGILIYFIHHTARSIQADNLIATVYAELVDNIKHIYPVDMGNEFDTRDGTETPADLLTQEKRAVIYSSKAGYLEAINSEGLMKIAREADLLLEVSYRPRDFIEDGGVLAIVYGDGDFNDDVSARLADCFILGKQKTPEQNAEFAISQLVEISGRALSTGINDPFTAMTCIDYLGSALCILTKKVFPSANRYDENNHLRVVANPFTFTGITNAAFNQIRQYARTNVAVTIRLLEALTDVASQARLPEHGLALKRQADMIFQGSKASLPEKQDRLDVEKRYELFLETFESNPNIINENNR